MPVTNTYTVKNNEHLIYLFLMSILLIIKDI